MSIKHSIYDTDPHFKIDPITRLMSTESQKVTLQQFDHNAERFTFEVPRLYEGHDLSLCDQVQVHYINIDAKTKKENTDVYDIDDIQISPDGEDVVICSWLIKNTATQYAGTLAFLLKFRCLVDGKVSYEWNTAPYKNITISEGMNNGDAIIEEYSDILSAWEQKLMAAGSEGVNVVEVAETEALQNIEKAKQEAVAVVTNTSRSPFANALKGVASGSIVTLKDISPLEHELKVKCDVYAISDMSRTIQTEINGEITSADVNEVFTIHDKILFGSWLESIVGGFGEETFNVELNRFGLYATDEYIKIVIGTKSLEIPEGANSYLKENCGFTFDSKGYNNTVTLNISKILGTNLTRIGKNMVPYPFYHPDQTTHGVKITQTNSTLVLNGTATADITFYIKWSNLLKVPKGIYAISGAPKGTTLETCYIGVMCLKDGKEAFYQLYDGYSYTAEIDAIREIYVSINAGTILNNVVLKPQIELGTKPTEFEPYKKPIIYSINTDGTVENCITSLYPTTMLYSDTEGVTLAEVEYNRDLNKAFAALEAALINNI